MSGQYSGEVCVADDGLINPTNFPCKSATLDTSLITGSGDKVAAIGTQVLTTTQAAETSWKGLQSPGVFDTPDSEVVYALMQPAVKGATDMNGVTGRLSTALHTYAAELEGIKPDLADLEERAAAFRERALKGYEVSNWEARGWLSNFETGLDGNAVPKADADEMTAISWKEHGPARDKNESLLREYDGILARISTAATTCANAIQRELKMVCVAPAEKITAEMIAASDLSGWGKPVEEQRNCTESVGHGLGGWWHNTWTGAASLIGRDATTGEWSSETARKTWWGVGDFVVSTLVVTSPISALLLTNEEGRNFYNDRANVAASSWGGLIGWDQQAHLAGENGWHKYEKDGVAALTESAANIGTFFIPFAGVAGGSAKAVLTSTRAGAFVAKTASHVAEFAIPASSYLVKGAVKVIDLGADLTKGGWRGLVDSLTPGPIRPNALPGIAGVATEAPHTLLPSKTPVSSSLGLEGAPPVHGSTAPGGGHVPDGSGAPGSTPDSAGGVPEPDGKGHAPETDGSASTPDGGGSGTNPDGGHSPDTKDWGDLSPEEFYERAADEQNNSAKSWDGDNVSATEYGQKQWNSLKGEFSNDTENALWDYSLEKPEERGITYHDINGALRSGGEIPENLKSHIDLIDAALNTRPLLEDVVVTRGTGVSHWGIDPDDVVGTTFHERAYVSTSLGGPAEAFAEKPAILHLTVPKGTPALWLEKFSSFGGGERELLLGRGLKWTAQRVVEVNGQWHVFGKALSE